MRILNLCYTKVKTVLISIFMVGCSSIFSQEAGDNLFGNLIHTVEIQFSQSNWADSLAYYYTLNQTLSDKIYLKGNVIVDGVPYTDVGVRYKGNSSYNHPKPKKPLKIDFNEFVSGQKIDGL